MLHYILREKNSGGSKIANFLDEMSYFSDFKEGGFCAKSKLWQPPRTCMVTYIRYKGFLLAFIDGQEFTQKCARIVLKNIVYHSTFYTKVTKSNSTIVAYLINGREQYGEVQYYLTNNSRSVIYAVLKKIDLIYDSISLVAPPPVDQILQDAYSVYSCGSFFKSVKCTENVCFVSVNCLISRCILIDACDISVYLTKIPNSFEHN